MVDSEVAQAGSLGNPVLLNKIDELRRLNISSMVPLPQLVVVGDQSAGKSSVLESLTGFPFPRAVNLCTRYATEIICRREETQSITASIRPSATASADVVAKLQGFRVELPTHDRNSKKFQEVFEQASITMGLRSGTDPTSFAPAFSKDVLRIEITGPKEEHLTIIDVPGIFEVATPGLTDKNDISLVKSMVMNYIEESRTVILAVVPCTADIATQQILKRAEEVDREGKRTIGVLTKPDLLTEKATKDSIAELVKGNRRDLTLGYFVIRNRGADDATSNLDQRNETERAFFDGSPWNELDRGRLGIDSLRLRLRELLMERTKHDFPIVKREIETQLRDKQERLVLMGTARISPEQQRVYLVHVASQFSEMGRYALDAYYTGHPVFDQHHELRLITRIREISEEFAKVLYEKGHQREFQKDSGDGIWSSDGFGKGGDVPASASRQDLYKISFNIPDETDFPELQELLAEPFSCQPPVKGNIEKYIREIYLHARGQELGTFGNFMLPATFREQSRKWKGLALAHVSNAILIIHHFIVKIMEAACPDEQVRYGLWTVLTDDLLACYRRAIEHTEFLLRVECEGKAVTCNPEFPELLDKNRQKREAAEKETSWQQPKARSKKSDADASVSQGNNVIDQICGDVHIVLRTYYEIARSRFVDEIYQQVVDHFLLNGNQSALRTLTPERVLSMTIEQLNSIAAEDPASQRARAKLEREIASLEKAKVVLRG
ncbi:dynamin family protein [Hypoxylon trugodes]|uniref:dynamin family protein n=1 Tax=Hypoxylon trugodes TaxID=326681 RepID=UPI00218E8A82|nr:dynamin family protein [Hypoxylon trugodes]KAI1384096.1 dynamin family protein [Hypoxylon trugodes]